MRFVAFISNYRTKGSHLHQEAHSPASYLQAFQVCPAISAICNTSRIGQNRIMSRNRTNNLQYPGVAQNPSSRSCNHQLIRLARLHCKTTNPPPRHNTHLLHYDLPYYYEGFLMNGVACLCCQSLLLFAFQFILIHS